MKQEEMLIQAKDKRDMRMKVMGDSQKTERARLTQMQQEVEISDSLLESSYQTEVRGAIDEYYRTIAAYDAAHAPERPGQEAQNLADARACGHGDQDDQT